MNIIIFIFLCKLSINFLIYHRFSEITIFREMWLILASDFTALTIQNIFNLAGRYC